jgi:hypothetical protein
MLGDAGNGWDGVIDQEEPPEAPLYYDPTVSGQ